MSILNQITIHAKHVLFVRFSSCDIVEPQVISLVTSYLCEQFSHEQAIKDDDVEVMEFLSLHRTLNAQRILIDAVDANSFKIAEFALSRGADPNVEMWGRSPPFLIESAAKKGNLQMVRLLVENGGAIVWLPFSSMHTRGGQPLVSASTIQVARYLIEEGAEVGIQSLLMASSREDLSLLKYYIEDCNAAITSFFLQMLIKENRTKALTYMFSRSIPRKLIVKALLDDLNETSPIRSSQETRQFVTDYLATIQ
jgi:hypothetical protein